MTLRLLYVHGIGGYRDVPDELAAWNAALASGMRDAGHSAVADRLLQGTAVETRFVYYGDLFDSSTDRRAGDLDTLTVEELTVTEGLLEGWIDGRLADAPGDDTLVRARARLNPPAEQGQGPGAILRILLNVATTVLGARILGSPGRWLTGNRMLGDLSQVARYLSRRKLATETLDTMIRARVLRELLDGPTVVVSHSLGTVVSYEALHHATVDVPLWVTIGSPLAMRSVVASRILPKPPRTPEVVGRWLNYWDRDDPVVTRPDLSADIGPNSRGVDVKTRRVDSDGLWVHSATTYLAKADVAGPIAEVITAMTRAS